MIIVHKMLQLMYTIHVYYLVCLLKFHCYFACNIAWINVQYIVYFRQYHILYCTIGSSVHTTHTDKCALMMYT